jgi:sigma-B regulation protein RsbU (phosphoserine phosphatase)
MKYSTSSWRNFLSTQPLYLAIAVAVYLILWVTGQRPDAVITLIYTFVLGNTGMIAMEQMRPLYSRRGVAEEWLAFFIVFSVVTPFIVTVSTLLVFWYSAKAGDSFFRYLSTGWKFPTLITYLFGIGFNFYLSNKERLEQRNVELQETVEQTRAERDQQEQELQRAREIQQALLPKEIPQVPGFDVVGAWEPARLVGGDYYDVIKLSDGRLGICIADVVGKSISAALLMASVQATVRAFALDSVSPATLCMQVNRVLCNNIAADKFVTFFYGILDSRNRTLHYSNAGHLQPILLQASGGSKQLKDNGAVLGVFRDWKYEDDSVQFEAGDKLLLFTDGITEASTADGEEFGEQRLIDAARAGESQAPGNVKARVLQDVRQFCHSQFSDDATLVVISAN